MARPEEKAQNMLNKWVKMRQEADRASSSLLYYGEEPLSKRRRPYLASECEYLQDAEKFRKDILQEIGEGVRKIQNAGMGEHAIRDLNDRINKLLREKFHWNRRIKELNGPDYNALERRQAREVDDLQQSSLRGSGGYRYFGAARDLPGVKELFERQAAKVSKRKRGELYKYITPDYYGLRDEEDGVLVALEQRAMDHYYLMAERHRPKVLKTATPSPGDSSSDDDEEEEEDHHTNATLSIGGITGARVAMEAHVAIPSQEIISRAILQQKKRQLLSRLTL